MLKVLIPTFMLFPTMWLTHPKWLWTTTSTHTVLIGLITVSWLKSTSQPGWTISNSYFATDPLSCPLMVLTCWLLRLLMLGSQSHINPEPDSRPRFYNTLVASLQMLLITAIGATEFIMFNIMFQGTLIPTHFIITGWGNEAEGLIPGSYFLVYTMAGPLALLEALLVLQRSTGVLCTLLMQYSLPLYVISWGHKISWAGCLIAYLVKMRLYGVHLWLRKAHVESPVVGSMVLAAVLLNLAGYGMMRMVIMLDALSKVLVHPFIFLALCGIFISGSICLRHTDLKSLIAYSSVSHMGLVAGGILIQTPWGFSGAIILMIAHGLVSSILFSLANAAYERTRSRTMILAGGLQLIFPLTAVWWFIANLANLALPPLPNLMREQMINTTFFYSSPWTRALTGAATLISGGYSLFMYLKTQGGPTPSHISNLPPFHSRERLLIALHVIPLFLHLAKPELVWGWCY
uniref:NADH-ubiquinone oxidoreductase chain 4 n=1 Tax=Danio albolineatus TaxID=27699 RepID=A0A140E9Z9_9TELE|nr:NADH dehydrogenase subunit 4 [Danio albolineatus]AMK97362.1 NADH dehydrogenase subunit 4 [Danio albolineatus]